MVRTVPNGIGQENGWIYLQVDLYLADERIGRLDLDETWFSNFGTSIRDDISEIELTGIFPKGWLRWFFDSLNGSENKPTYYYLFSFKGGDVLMEQKPNSSARQALLLGQTAEGRAILRQHYLPGLW